MQQFIENRLSESIAKIISEDIQFQRRNYYYFLSKINPWNNDESFNPMVDDRQINEAEARDNMVFIKKIKPSDISLATRRVNWNSGTVYVKWDHTKIMHNTDFYVLTDNMDVYKCLDNNNGMPSTVKPIGRNIIPRRQSDGYIWKYMYSIGKMAQRKFLDANYMPIQRALGSEFYERGSIAGARIIDGGVGYENTTLVSIVFSTTQITGSGAVLASTISSAGQIINVSVISGGSGYNAGARARVNSITGHGAIIELIIVGGVITSANVRNGGNNYLQTDSVSVEVGGAAAYPIIDATTGSLREIVITDRGIGYSSAPTVQIIAPSNFQVSGRLVNNTSAMAEAFIKNGSIDFIRILDPGVGYFNDNSTTIAIRGDGIGAKIAPIIRDGVIIDTIIENQGINYTMAYLDVFGTGSGAKLVPIFSTKTIQNEEQKVVENLTEPGAIYSVEITNGGSNYGPRTFAIIDGTGTGATCEITIASGGIISNIRMLSFGKNYARATIRVVDPDQLGSGFEGYAILPPFNGHGYNAVSELYANTLQFSSNLRNDLTTERFIQDYRIFGILKNPLLQFTKKAFSSPEELIGFTVRFSNTINLQLDSQLIFDNKHTYIVGKISQDNTVFLLPTTINAPAPIGNIVQNDAQNTVFQINEIITSSSVDKYSGDILTVTRSAPFTFNEFQSISIKSTIVF